jgi:hypothetical protein
VDFTSLSYKSLARISDFTCPREGFMNVESLTIADCEELTLLWSNDVGLLKSLPCLSYMEVYNRQKLVSLVAEEVKEQPQQGMSSTRNDAKSLPKALMYNNKCLEYIYIVNCDSLTHIATGQLPPTLKRLNIRHCKNIRILLDENDINSFSSSTSLLEDLDIDGCPSLKSLTSCGELPTTLKNVSIWNCKTLESVAKSFHQNSSLERITILCCENLKSLTDEGLLPCNLRLLWISDCEKMRALPNCIHSITSLQELRIEKCPGVESFPGEGFPTSLTSLKIRDCDITEALLDWGLQKLTSLQHLQFGGGCPHLLSFPEMTLSASLTSLHISNLPNLKHLSSKGFQCLSSLKTLGIGWCEKLMTFPDDGLPPSLLDLRIFCCEMFTSFPKDGLPPLLQQLHIANCPLLKEHCKKGQGREWSKIAHIPFVAIDRRFIYDPEPEEQNRPMHQNDLEYLFRYN